MDNTPKVIANTPCCVCGGTASAPFFDRRFDKFNYAGEFHMRRCDGCGLLFCSPRLTDAGIAALYDANYYVFQKDDGGYFARTAEITCSAPTGVADQRAMRLGYYAYIESGPKPSVAVSADRDVAEPGVGAFWGEVQTNVRKAMGCCGASARARCW